MIIRNEPDVYYKFIKEDAGSEGIAAMPSKRIEITLADDVSLEDLLETFQEFIIASGFHLAPNECVAIIRETEQERDTEDESDSEI